jgi:hypothetical protein
MKAAPFHRTESSKLADDTEDLWWRVQLNDIIHETRKAPNPNRKKLKPSIFPTPLPPSDPHPTTHIPTLTDPGSSINTLL